MGQGFFCVLVGLLLLGVSHAFAPPQRHQLLPARLAASLLGDLDTMTTMNIAAYCLESNNADASCDLEAIRNRLEEQHGILKRMFVALNDAIFKLCDSSFVLPPTEDPVVFFDRASQKLRSEIDLMCLINMAEHCVSEGCKDDEEAEAILSTLHEQQSIVASRIYLMSTNIHPLKAAAMPWQ